MEAYAELHIRGDKYMGGYTNGMTHCMTESTRSLTLISADEEKNVYQSPRGCAVTLYHKKRDGVTEYHTAVENRGSEPVWLDMLASFALSGIRADTLYRMESFWSAEGRLKADSLIDLNLEKSWASSGHGLRALKFGSVGSMPVKSYFPFIALEDRESGHFTGALLYAPASWQIEVLCCEDTYRIAGGLADRDFGAWCKLLKPGERMETPRALVAEAEDFYTLCDLLVKAQHPRIAPADREMPIVFNEWCTTWGNPTAENIRSIVDRIAGLGLGYFVIDAGWYRGRTGWDSCGGDWIPNREMFPEGIRAVTDYIRGHGMIPGIWFEVETAGENSAAYHDLADHFLARDGYPIRAGVRKFWDMEDPAVIEYLTERVIHFLKDNGFGYMKVDYNETIGPGCDGCESAGEGLRRKVNASQAFYRAVADQVPGIVLENCASGGHRLEPSMMELFSQASFSDAHECACIPLIAANLHRVIRPEQSQIWCVLKAKDSPQRTEYSLVNTFLGRMCLSGEVRDLSDAQLETVRQAIAFYRQAADIIQYGKTVRIETTARSYLRPTGYQVVERVLNGRKLTVAHRFEASPALPAPEGKILAQFGRLDGDFTACAWISEG